MPNKIIVSVISDLVTDRRVQRECDTLQKTGYDILLIGRKSERDFQLQDLPYRTRRFFNPFRRGPLMYLVFNLQLFFYLLFSKVDILWSNDLDTLLPNFLVSRIKGIKLIYDSHEYFTESVYKKASKGIWQKLESILFPRLKNVITVNNSIKEVYEKKYVVPVTVIRNLPFTYVDRNKETDLLFPVGKKILLMQGMGINENRGAEEAVLMMKHLPDEFNLYFIGGGTLFGKLKQMVEEMNLHEKVFFINALPYHEMMKYTKQSFLGLIFEKIDSTHEHLFALPNRLFDYIQAGLPVLTSRAVEIEAVIKKYKVGDFIESFGPEKIAEKIIAISNDPQSYHLWKTNTVAASAQLNWENEEKILIQFMKNLS